MPMKPEVKDQWVKALRSEEYEQGHGYLRDSNDRYCCLGVLCDLAVKAGVISEPELASTEGGEGESYSFGPDRNHDILYLPDVVRDWAGLATHNPTYGPDPDADMVDAPTLAGANDDGVPFDQIAELIEAHL